MPIDHIPDENSTVDHNNTETEELGDNEKMNKEKIPFRKQFRTRNALKAMFISFTLLVLSLFTFCHTLPLFVTETFERTGSSFNTKDSSIFISIVTLVTNMVFATVVERFSRKVSIKIKIFLQSVLKFLFFILLQLLHVVSAIFTAISFFAFSFYCMKFIDHSDYVWMAPVCFAGVIVSSCMGVYPISYIIAIEIFPKEVLQINHICCVFE